jgi:hypothetical protein
MTLGQIVDLNNVLIYKTENNISYFMKIISSLDVANVPIIYDFPIFENQMVKLSSSRIHENIHSNNDISPMSLILTLIDKVPYFNILPKQKPGKKIINVYNNVEILEVTNYKLVDINDPIMTLFKFSINGIPQKTLYSGVEYDTEIFLVRPDCLAKVPAGIPSTFKITTIDKTTEETFSGTLIYKKTFDEYVSGMLTNVRIGKFQFVQLYNYNVNNNCLLNQNLYESIVEIGKINYIESGKCNADTQHVPILFSYLDLCQISRTKIILPCETNNFCGETNSCYGPCEDINFVCKLVSTQNFGQTYTPQCVEIRNTNFSTFVFVSVFIIIFIVFAFIILMSRK